jgi:hypothetical protein
MLSGSIPLIAILVLGAAALLLGIIDWFMASSLGSRLNFLEQELEKRSLDLQNPPPATQPQSDQHQSRVILEDTTTTPMNLAAQTMPSARPEPSPQQNQIQVVRSVRNAYAEDPRLETSIIQCCPSPHEQPNHPTPQPPSDQPFINHSADLFVAAQSSGYPPQDHLAPQQPPLAPPQIEPQQIPQAQTPLWADRQPPQIQPAPPAADSDIMAVVEDDGGQIATQSPTLLLQVYSETHKDADFEQLSKEFQNRFQTSNASQVLLDFSRVIFLYEKELGYLEQLAAFLHGRGTQLLFINAAAELTQLLKTRPTLFECIRDTVTQ